MEKGRNVSNLFDNVSDFESYPSELREFINEYGDLTITDCKDYNSDVINELQLLKKFFKSKNVIDSLPFNKKLYKVGYFYPDHYMVYMDEDGLIYQIGDYYYIMGNSLQEGIENILEDNWDDSSEWDSELNDWIK